MNISLNLTDMKCRRCRRQFVTSDDVEVLSSFPREGKPLLDGDIVAIVATYHTKCVPSILFHRFAGSHPVGQSLPVSSPRKRHDAGEGLSRRRNRKRLPHRQRKKIAAKKRFEAQYESDRRQDERTEARTIVSEKERGVTPRLCTCVTFTRNTYLVTKNGYCRSCGGWRPEVFREHMSREALEAAVDALALHDRERMREYLVTGKTPWLDWQTNVMTTHPNEGP